MTTVAKWTGREAKALREARRMSIRAFAAHLGVATASVANWEKRGSRIRLRTETQEILDRVLAAAPAEAHDRFTALLNPPAGQTPPATGDGAERLRHALAHPGRADLATAAHLGEQIHHLDGAYHRTPSASLIGTASQRHAEISFLTSHAPAGPVRQQLLQTLAASAVLMGQLVWDAALRRDHKAALGYFDQAVRAGHAGGDSMSTARAQLRMSLVALYGQKNPVMGLHLASQAAATSHATSTAFTGLALLHAAEAHATMGQARDCETSLHTAGQLIDTTSPGDPAASLVNAEDTHRMAGSCHLRLGHPTQAARLLHVATRRGGTTKATAIAAANLTIAYAHQRQPDRAVASLHHAIDIIAATRGGGGLTTAFTALRTLNPWRTTPDVQHVHDRLHDLMTA
ncbi:helix-turn-helix domain-containing protein [Mangrovihabitans endophyticus]|uniref:HTH cro/C1-type domain-containing protein n=1 Tax=Mangrovihabitans endophyticus TaxID=1751298 RepID=A0A8J3FS38_9ACTN|nr:helix-turn-helix transcriptional regulator [Mangrovihabitans endophyticus]GGL21128.1 hypothetical protein GCM10012284_64740 [Mangrovihabitans endophyticus]